MKVNRLICITMLITLPWLVFAQQESMYSLYHFEGVLINPAYAGNTNALSTSVQVRYQWMGLEGAPKTYLFSSHAPVQSKRIAVGVVAMTEKIGLFRTSGAELKFAHKTPMEKGTLSFGLTGGIQLMQFDINGVVTIDEDKGINNYQDLKKILPRFGIGGYYQAGKWYVGLSAPNILKSKYFKNTDELHVARQYPHVFLTGGALIDVRENIKAKPSVLMKYVKGAPFQADLNVDVLLMNTLWLGCGYRTGEALITRVQYHIFKGLTAGYAYDISFNKLSQIHTGSHEFSIRYDLRLNKEEEVQVRYF